MYKLINCFDEKTNTKVLGGVLKINSNGSDVAIPLDEANTDYQEYLKWLAEGNLPRPADFVEPSPTASVAPESAE